MSLPEEKSPGLPALQGAQHFAGEVRDGAKGVRRFFARRGVTSPFGKLEDLGRLRVASDTASLLRERAARAGLPIGEYVRMAIELGVHGREEIERRQSIRLDAIEVIELKRDEKVPTE